MKRYLVLGGAGFIGTHLSKNLIADGHEVTIVDNCSTSSPPTYDVKFHKEDVSKWDGLEDAIADADIVYNLAGSVGVKNVVQNPHTTMMNNLAIATKVFPLCSKHGKKVIFTSSSEVYGSGENLSEDQKAVIPEPKDVRWSYAAAKLASEYVLTTCSQSYRILRLFNVVGPGQLGEYGMVLPRFINAAKNNEDIVIYGDGQQTRSFCHVADAVDMFRKLESAPNAVYNIGTADKIRISTLAYKVRLLLNSKSEIVYKEMRDVYGKNSGDIYARTPSLSRIRSVIDYKVNNTIDKIILDMANQ